MDADEPLRIDPPAVADELPMLRSWLDYYRATVRRQAAGLTPGQLSATLPPSTLTLGGIIKHLSFVEGYWFRYVLDGAEQHEPWASARWDDDADWDWHSARHDDPQAVRDLHAAEVAASDAVLEAVLAEGEGIDRLAARPTHGKHASLRWILVHMIEEYSRHAGHADLIRESIDGAVDL
ncbi:MAG: DinB family protein [Nocardioides sp.]